MAWPSRAALAGFLAYLLVAHGLAGAYYVLFYRPARLREAVELWERELSTRADTRKLGVERWLAELSADARTIGSYPTAVQVASRGTGSVAVSRDPHLTQILASWLPIEGHRSATLFGATPAPIAQAGPGPDAACIEAARQILAGASRSTDIAKGDAGAPILVAAMPIAARGGRTIGASVITLDPDEWLYPFLAIGRDTRGGSSESLLMRREADDVVFLSPLAFDRSGVLAAKRPLGTPRLAARDALGRREGFGEFVDYRNEPILAATRSLNEGRWGLVTKVDRREALADIEVRLGYAVRGTSLVILALGLAGLALVFGVERAQHSTLLEHQADVALLLDQANDAILILSAEGQLIAANRRASEMYGLPEGDLLRRTVADLRPDDLRGEAVERLAELRREGRLTFEAVHHRSDGARFPVEVSARLARWAGREAIVSIVRDVSDRRRAQDALQASEARYRLLAENVTDVIWTLDVATRRFTYVSPSVERLRGYTPEQALEQTLAQALTPEQDRQLGLELEQALREIRAGDRSRLTRVHEVELPRRDGSLVATEVVTSFLFDESGQPVTVLGVTRDISERRRGEAALRERGAHLQAVLESPDEPVFAVDARLRYTSFNRAHATATRRVYAREIAVGDGVLDAVPEGDDREHARANFERALGGERFVEERVWGDALHDRRSFDVAYNPIRADGGEAIGVAVFAVDRTERRRAAEELQRLNQTLEGRVAERTVQLEQANRELEAFAYSVSHDLRAPLRAINGFSRILGVDHAGSLDAEALGLLARVQDNGRRMERLIDDLLAFSRTARHELRRARVDVHGLARAAFQELAGSSGRSPILDVGELPEAFADPALLRQVVINLLSNAIKFSAPREHPAIAIRGHVQDGETVFAVSDNGVGFDMRYVDKLFGVFQRLHGSREFEGTGVGLALVQRIVARHGGRVWAEGEVGHGATVWFALPRGGEA